MLSGLHLAASEGTLDPDLRLLAWIRHEDILFCMR